MLSRARWPARVGRITATSIVCLIASCFADAIDAQTQQTNEPLVSHDSVDTQSKVLDELRRVLIQQQKTLEDQGRQIDQLRQQVGALTAELAAVRGQPVTRDTVANETVAHDTVSSETVAQGQAERERTGEGSDLPAELVEAGEFPGSIRVPGTEAAIKIGGHTRVTLVHTLAALGSDDRFVTSSIPVGDPQSDEEARTVYSVAPSRANIDVRMPSGIGPIRSFMEADFDGPSSTLRLRHAYLQTQRWIFGQTWSVFSDREAEPHGIDFEGLNAISLFRQPQIRYTYELRPRTLLAVSIENPAPELTGAEGLVLVPDFVARLRWNARSNAGRSFAGATHVQAALLLRQLRGEVAGLDEAKVSTGAIGATVSGIFVPPWRAHDRLKFAAYAGSGIGRYIKDLEKLGGQDAVYDTTRGTLHALPVMSGYIGYEWLWRPTITSTVTYGVVNVSNLDIQPDNALHRTQRTSVNVTWTPIPQGDLVAEFLAGRRVDKSLERGASSQVQLGWVFRF